MCEAKLTIMEQTTEGLAPLAIVMISLNEEHNMEAVLENIDGFAQEVFLVDSFSSDKTVEVALRHGVHVVQRRFRGFGDQWNFAMRELPITAPWTMKLDPDERLTDELKDSIRTALVSPSADAFIVRRRLWFMTRPLPVIQQILRIWRTGSCRFSDVLVNEHPIVEGTYLRLNGELEHFDSPNLDHWLEKQNAYTTAEAYSFWSGSALSAEPHLFGTALQRRMWFKANFYRLPLRHLAMLLYCLLVQGAWRAGTIGFIWARLRGDVFRLIDYKRKEMALLGDGYAASGAQLGPPHPRAKQSVS